MQMLSRRITARLSKLQMTFIFHLDFDAEEWYYYARLNVPIWCCTLLYIKMYKFSVQASFAYIPRKLGNMCTLLYLVSSDLFWRFRSNGITGVSIMYFIISFANLLLQWLLYYSKFSSTGVLTSICSTVNVPICYMLFNWCCTVLLLILLALAFSISHYSWQGITCMLFPDLPISRWLYCASFWFPSTCIRISRSNTKVDLFKAHFTLFAMWPLLSFASDGWIQRRDFNAVWRIQRSSLVFISRSFIQMEFGNAIVQRSWRKHCRLLLVIVFGMLSLLLWLFLSKCGFVAFQLSYAIHNLFASLWWDGCHNFRIAIHHLKFYVFSL